MPFRYLIIDTDTRVIFGETLDITLELPEGRELVPYNGGTISYAVPKKIKVSGAIETATDVELQIAGGGPYTEVGPLEFADRAAKLFAISADEIARQVESNPNFAMNADIARALALQAEANRLRNLPIVTPPEE